MILLLVLLPIVLAVILWLCRSSDSTTWYFVLWVVAVVLGLLFTLAFLVLVFFVIKESISPTASPGGWAGGVVYFYFFGACLCIPGVLLFAGSLFTRPNSHVTLTTNS